jgi:beta-phosphoglucomutase-like phosphatase (HAD superfamily)
MRIAIDIDSTLFHYWDVLEAVVRRRFGVALPYREQVTWEVPGLRPEQLQAAVEETHNDEHILAAVPYPGAVETVRGWHDAGHYVHITSHRRAESRGATERWLERIGMPYDDLHCSHDKVSRARELGIDLLIDDSPVNLSKALAAGMTAATLMHPWNAEICDEEDDIVCAPDWPALRARLRPLLEEAPA